jgi:MGT family glycosyltransferase
LSTLLAPEDEIIALDENISTDLIAQLQEKANRVSGLASLRFLWGDFLLPLARVMVPEVDEAINSFKPDVLLVDQQALAGAIIAQRQQMPWATLATSGAGALQNPLAELPKVWEWVKAQVAQLQSEFGLDPATVTDISSSLMVIFSSRELVGQGDYPTHYQFVGPSISERSGHVDFPWRDLSDHPRILVSLGTVNRERGVSFFQTVIEAFADENIQVIMVAPKELAAEAPSNIIIREYVPQLALLDHVQAVVCHAGQNTVSEALAHGLPLLVAPIKDDQPVIASQVVQAGCGLRLKFGRIRPGELLESVKRVMRESEFCVAAQKIKASFEVAGGAGRAAELVEQLL